MGYLLGTVPFGILFSRALKGKDPRDSGSRNIGFTNVLREVGYVPAVLTLAGDVGKGMLAAWLGVRFAGPLGGELGGIFAVLGHCYPVFLRFKGGKAVATGFGVLGILFPVAGWVTLGIWGLITGLSRYVSLGSLVAFGSLPAVLFLLEPRKDAVLFGMALGFLVFIRHRENIRRLMGGEEGRLFDRR